MEEVFGQDRNGYPAHRVSGSTGLRAPDLDENTLVDINDEGNICAVTLVHASTRAGIPEFSYEQITA